MFDDPKKTLRRMEEELRAAEREDQEEQEPPFGSEFEFTDDEELIREAKALLREEDDIPIRNHANGYGARPMPGAQAPDYGRMVYDPEEPDEDVAVFAQEPKPKGAGGLVILALLELIGILAVILWWLKWLS